jgi:hypothetical protein
VTAPSALHSAPTADRGARAVAALGLALLLLHAAVAVAIGLDAYADGSWFDFAALAGEPWRLVWHNYPTRITAYLVRYAPAYGLLRAHMRPDLALGAGHALWQLAPVVSAAACYRLLPRGMKLAALAPTAYFLLLGLLTWGFPTETWLAAAFAWPSAILLLYGRDTVGHALLGGALLTAAVFSHETALLLIPLFLLIGVWRLREGARRSALGAILASIVSVSLWLVAKRLLPPDPIIAQGLRGNAAGFFGLAAFVDHPALKKDMLIAAVAVLALGAAGLKRSWALPAIGMLLLLGLFIVTLDFGVAGAARYQVRSVAALGLAAGIAVVLLDKAMDSALQAQLRRRGPMRTVLGVAAVLMVLAAGWENLRFASAWVRYDRAASALINCPDAACDTLITLPAAISHSPAGWAWAAPFYSILASRDLETSSLVRDDVLAGQPIQPGTLVGARRGVCGLFQGPEVCARALPKPAAQVPPLFMPLSCRDATALRVAGRRPQAVRSLAHLVCGRGP